MRIFKNILLYFFISILLISGAKFLSSDFITAFLTSDLVTILITLFGLNTTILAILVSKISEIADKHPDIEPGEVISEMRLSLLEFFLIIIIAFVANIILDSTVVDFQFKSIIIEAILLSTLIYSLVIIWDTGQAVFVLISEDNVNS